YATSLLHRLGHPAADAALATLTASPLTPYPSMMDVVDLARRASSSRHSLSLGELETVVRAALRDVVEAVDEPGCPELVG
ncbi:MAG: hypothetical protein ABL966_05385, partial [Acidimicrobiales bacterium]